MALIKCSNCGKDISDTTSECIHCGTPIKKEIVEVPAKKSNTTKIVVAVVIGVVVLAVLGVVALGFLIFAFFDYVDLKEVADNAGCDTYYCNVASDGSYLELDTNPLDLDNFSSAEAYKMMKNINRELELPESLDVKIGATRALDGRQSEEFDSVTVSWTYHPDKGLEILYELED